MIISVRHKGLEAFYRTGSALEIQAAHASKLWRILGLLDATDGPQAMNVPSFKLHPLKGDLAGHWSVWVNGNWRVTFRFTEAGAELVDYQDYH